jgi:hypothetical protein
MMLPGGAEDGWSPDQDLNPGPLKYKADVLAT